MHRWSKATKFDTKATHFHVINLVDTKISCSPNYKTISTECIGGENEAQYEDKIRI